jgi:DNA-binding CsgD family transcriptional regulator
MLKAAIFEIYGRDEELAAIQSCLESPASRALVLEGEAGIGKTTLWHAALQLAAALGQRVIAARPAGAEAQLSLSGLGDLLRGVPAEAIGALPEIQQRALAVVLAEKAPAAEGLDGHVLGAAFLTLTRTLAEERPLVIAVDDLQWLDGSSAAVLVFALRRLRGANVRLLASCRGQPGAPLPFACELALAGEIERLAVGPLSEGALHRLLQRQLGISLPRAFLHAVRETSGGNPFFALELARTGIEQPDDGPIRLPRNLDLLVRERLQRLPSQTREALAYASALSDPTLAVLARVGVGEELEPALSSGVIEVEQGRLRFDHPLLASAAWNAASPVHRREIHGALAEALDNPEQRARHLALATVEPNAEVASMLEQAAADVYRRAAPFAAAELYELARRLTPPDDTALWARLTERAAALQYEAGEWDRPLELAAEALERLPAGPERAEILLVACEMRPGQLDLCRQTLDEAGDGVTRVRALNVLCEQLAFYDQARQGAAIATEACELAERLGRRDLLGVSLIYRAAMKMQAELPGVQEDLAGAREIENELGALPTTLHNSYETWSAFASLFDDDPDEARPLLEERIRTAAERGDERNYCLIALDLVQLEIDAGNWSRAQALAEECADLALVAGYADGSADLSRMLGLIAALEGDFTAARELLEESLLFHAQAADPVYETLTYAAILFVRLCERDVEAIGEEVDAYQERVRSTGSGNADPPWRHWTQGDEIEALVVSGKAEEARRRIEDLRRVGKKRRWQRFLAWADRGDGLLLAGEGDLAGAEAALQSALRHHEKPPSLPFERARTLLVHGQVLRRSKKRRAAREVLNEALAEFERLGARHFVKKTREELTRIGGRTPAGVGELTATEERIARLVVNGLSNKEVAAQSFVTVRTVEATLTRIYAKLGVRSRLQLSRVLADSPESDR